MNSQPQSLAIYLRVSTDKQEDNTSKENQLKYIKKFITLNNWDNIPYEIYDDTQSASHHPKFDFVNDELDEFTDFEDFSPSIFLRKDLRRLIYDASLKRFNKLLVYSHDRLSRDIYESLFIRQTLKRLNIEIIYCKPGEQLNSGNASSDTFFENLLSSLAALEANIIGGRTFLGNRTNISNNLWAGGPPPYGYYLTPSPNPDYRNKHILTLNTLEKSVVKTIFNLYTLGYSPKDIANFIKTEYPYNTDRTWTLNSIKSILTNPIYTGTIVWNKKGGSRNPKKKKESEHIKSNYIEKLAIIDSETWNKSLYIRELQRNNPKFLSTQFLLKDIVRCKECGNKLICKNHGNSSGSVYICNNCPETFNIKANILHEIVLNETLSSFTNLLSNDDFLDNFYLEYSKRFILKQEALIKEKQQLEQALNITNDSILKSQNKLNSLYNDTVVDLTDSTEYNPYICLLESLKEYQTYLELTKKTLINSIDSLNTRINIQIKEKIYIKDLFSKSNSKFDSIIKIKDVKLRNRCLRLFIYEIIDEVLIDSDRNIEIFFK